MSRAGGGRPTVESGITLDIRNLKRDGLLRPGLWAGSWQWRWGNTQKPVAVALYRVEAQEEAALLRIESVTRFDYMGKPVSTRGHTIHLITSTPPYGGRRWWFICPRTGRRAMKLHLPYGAHEFASRHAYRLGYAVQRESARDRAYRKARKARHRIGGSDNLAAPMPRKPKWMRWPTYWKHVETCRHLEGQTLGFLIAGAEKLLGRRLTA